jgi:hypothetical protein
MTPEANRVTLPTPTAIVARRPPKVSKVGSLRCLDAVGEDLVKFGEPECRQWLTPVSRRHGPGAPP